MRDVKELVHGDARLRALFDVAAAAGDDPAHDVHHCLRVALWTIRIGGDAVDPHLAVAAALLHDIVNVPKDSPERARASELSAERARGLLSEQGFSPAEIDLVCEAIRDHSFSRGGAPRSPLGKALQDADRLEALGAIGIFRCAITGVRMGARPFHAEDPFAAERALDERAFSVDHFFAKLLGLSETMQTDAGRREAERRTEILCAFLDALGSELGAAPRDFSASRRR